MTVELRGLSTMRPAGVVEALQPAGAHPIDAHAVHRTMFRRISLWRRAGMCALLPPAGARRYGSCAGDPMRHS